MTLSKLLNFFEPQFLDLKDDDNADSLMRIGGVCVNYLVGLAHDKPPAQKSYSVEDGGGEVARGFTSSGSGLKPKICRALCAMVRSQKP